MAKSKNPFAKGKLHKSHIQHGNNKKDRAFRSKMSINDIRALAWNATQGSTAAYKELQTEYRKLAKIANSRMSKLKKAGFDMFAYDRAAEFLTTINKKHFSLVFAPSTDYKLMVRLMEEAVTFVNAKTSTVSGARTALDKKLEKIAEYTGKTYTPEQKLKLGRLLSSDTVSTLLRDVRGNSEDVLDALEELSLTDIDAEEITSIIDKYLAGYNPFEDDPFSANIDNLNYDEMMEELQRLYQSEDEDEDEGF